MRSLRRANEGVCIPGVRPVFGIGAECLTLVTIIQTLKLFSVDG